MYNAQQVLGFREPRKTSVQDRAAALTGRGAMTMKHEIHRVTGFRIVGSQTLEVRFADGVVRTIDFAPVSKGELYGPLADPEFFRRVRLDPEAHTLVWPNGADFDPATLHDWPAVAEEFARKAEAWTDAESNEP